MTGEIPAELGNLSNLHWLSLYNNQLTGAIPIELGDLSNLQILYLNRNQLTGAIPPELGGLANLYELYLADNQLTGAIPPELGGLGKPVRIVPRRQPVDRVHSSRATECGLERLLSAGSAILRVAVDCRPERKYRDHRCVSW